MGMGETAMAPLDAAALAEHELAQFGLYPISVPLRSWIATPHGTVATTP